MYPGQRNFSRGLSPVRLFTAVELPEAVRAELLSLQTGLMGLKWTTPENLHLTLRFIGETLAENVPAIKAALRTVQASQFSLRLSGLGLFERPGQTILWAGFEDCRALLALKQRIDAALAANAGTAPDRGRFSPHVTLGRSKKAAPDALRDFTGAHGRKIAEEFTVASFVLFRSMLAPGGAIHHAEESFTLD